MPAIVVLNAPQKFPYRCESNNMEMGCGNMHDLAST